MAIIVKAQITITKGFDTWQAMVKSQEARMQELGMKFLFAGTEKDNPNQLHAIMIFPNMEAIQAFGGDEELTTASGRSGRSGGQSDRASNCHRSSRAAAGRRSDLWVRLRPRLEAALRHR